MKTIKHSEQNIKVEITLYCCKIRVINAFWQNFGGNPRKALKKALKKSREFCFVFTGVWESAPTANIAPATQLVKYLIFIYKQLLVQNGKTTATRKQTLVFHQQTTTKWGAPDQRGFSLLWEEASIMKSIWKVKIKK